MHEELMEQVVGEENLERALRAVKRKRGAAGIDKMTTEELEPHFRRHGTEIRAKLVSGRWTPSPVRRVEIPKPSGGKRQLGIPTVIDRLVQQALLQVLQPIFDPRFSESSYGFRPGRSAHDAVRVAQRYVREGKDWVVDIDIARFFDVVNHDILMRRVAEVIRDKRVLGLIGRYLRAGVLTEGVVVRSAEGTPQGGPLSPLLANIYLDALDRELERRGLRFCRYADDCNIYVGSEAAAKRVLAGITAWIEKHLRLKVNEAKSGAGRPWERKFLGFRLNRQGQVEAAPESVERFKRKVRGDLVRQPLGHESAVTRRVAAVRSRLVGILPVGGATACDFPTGRMGAAAHTEMFLAALAWRNGTPAGFTSVGHWGTVVETGSGTSRRLAHSGERTVADSVIECNVAALRVCDAIGSCGANVRPLGSTAGYGKPYVRWCGRVAGPQSPSPDPIGLLVIHRSVSGRLGRGRAG